jgi:hypothetical protein
MISLKFRSGRRFRIVLYRNRSTPARRLFEIKFVAADGEVRHGSATVTKVIDRLRRLIVKKI